MSTPHISAAEGDFAPSVIMPGDPKRARHIADTFLSDVRVVTEVRGMTGFTGTYQGTPVSVMPHGMGMPSSAIYFTELARFYGVERMIRVGTCGGYQPDLEIGSIIVADAATTNSNMPTVLGMQSPLLPSAALLQAAQDTATATGVDVTVGSVFTSDTFYDPTMDAHDANREAGIQAVEMETAALYGLGQTEGFDALSFVTVSDHLGTGEQMTADERQTTVDKMIKLALDTVVRVVSPS